MILGAALTKRTNLLQYTHRLFTVWRFRMLSLSLCMCLCALCFMSADAQVNVSAQLENDKYHGPGKTTVYVTITNSNESNIGDIRLKAGGIDTVLGQILEAGSTLTYEGEIQISEEAISKGFLTISILYSSEGLESLSQALCYITRLEDKVEGSLFCVPPDRALSPNEAVPVSLVFANTGYTDIKNGRLFVEGKDVLQESFILSAKDSLMYELVLSPEEIMALQARVECESAISGTKYSFSLSIPEFRLIDEEVLLTVAGSHQAIRGENHRLSLNIENKGNTSYRLLELDASINTSEIQLPEVLKPGDFISLPLTITDDISSSAEIVFEFNGVRDDGVSSRFASAPFRLELEENGLFHSETATEETAQENADNNMKLADYAGSLLFALIGVPHFPEYVFAAALLLSSAVIVAFIRRSGRNKTRASAGRKTDV